MTVVFGNEMHFMRRMALRLLATLSTKILAKGATTTLRLCST